MHIRWKTLLFAVAISLTVSSAQALLQPLSVTFPLNGDFAQGDKWWTTRGNATIDNGQAIIGLPYCLWPYTTEGEVGAIASTQIPNFPFRLLRYHYRIYSGSVDALEVVAVTSMRTVLLDQQVYSSGFNCHGHQGDRSVAIDPRLLAGEPWFQLEFRVTHVSSRNMIAFVDNIVLSP